MRPLAKPISMKSNHFVSNTNCCTVFIYFVSSLSLAHICCSFCLLMLGHPVYIHRTEKELPSTKLHTLLLDHQSIKLTWYIDWPKKEVLFNVDDAFTDDTDWFSFGFSQRGQIEGSDVCFFVRNIYDESYNEAIVSIEWTTTLGNRLQRPSDFLRPLSICLYMSIWVFFVGYI